MILRSMRFGHFWFLSAGFAAALLSGERAHAEGSAQLGQIATGNSRGLYPETVLHVDVLAGDTHLNIAARNPAGNTLSVSVTDPSGTTTSYPIDDNNGLLDAATVPGQLPDAGHPVRSIAVTPGTYTVQFSDVVEPFDITVTQTLPTVQAPFSPGNVPSGGGRLSSKDWRVFAQLPGQADLSFGGADFYVRTPVGEDNEYIWRLDFEGLKGGQMCLVANDLGLPGEFARSSQSFETIQNAVGGTVDKFSLCDDLSGFDLYVNPPNSPQPNPEAPELDFIGIGTCGAILEGAGGGFAFDASLPATYELVIDADNNSVFDPNSGDIVLAGGAEAGPNSVAWDGRDNDGNPLPVGAYAAKLYLRLGEFHFTASDVEGLNPGVAVSSVNPDTLAETSARVYWDDTDLDNSTGTPANPIRSTPDGVTARHGWNGANLGGQVYSGPGEDAFVDTWVFGAEATAQIAFNIYSGADDEDADGLSNTRECAIGSVFDNPDTDDDGVADGFEATPSGPVTDSDDDGTVDVLDNDDDNDGIPTAAEDPDPNANNDPADSRDTDGDGIPDYLEADDDGDGISTSEESADPDNNGSPSDAQDSDDDGIPDFLDLDDDGDTIPTVDEQPDPDGDGIPDDALNTDATDPPNYLDADDDGDGIPTRQEIEDAETLGEDDVDGDGDPNWLDTDSDNDGIDDADEGTEDANDNGVPDYLEVPGDAGTAPGDSGTAPGDAGGPSSDAGAPPPVDDLDADDDGLPDSVECPATPCRDTDGDGTPDELDTDDDNDTIPTAQEVVDAGDFGGDDLDDDGKPNWLDTDSDADGVPDATENAGDGDANNNGVPDYLEAGTAPLDSDGDGLPDVAECDTGSACPDTDGDGTPDKQDADDDNDGIPTADEVNPGGAPKDTDGDGIPNHLDPDDDNDTLPTATELGGSPPVDSDGDGKPDYLDPDDDGDRVPTQRELTPVGQPQDTDGDGKPDHLDVDDDGDGKLTKDELGSPDNPRDTDGDQLPDYLDPDDGAEAQAATLEGGGFRCALQPGVSAPLRTGWLLLAGLGWIAMRRRRGRKQPSARPPAGLLLGIAWATGSLLVSAKATAEPSGFALNRYDASERGSDWFSGESLDLRGQGRFAFGVIGDWAHKPLVTYDGNGNELEAVVQNQLFVNLGAAVILADRLRIGANIPVLLFQDGNTATVNGTTYGAQEGVNIGDARLGLDVRLLGEYGDPLTLAVGGQLFFPTGSRAAFSGDGKVRFVPRVALAGDIAMFAYSARVGIALRGQRQDFAGQAFGTDLQLGVTAGLRLLDKALLIGPELWASTVISDGGEGFFERRTTPVEGVLGAHYFAGAWRFGVGAGPGFTSGVGSPAVRVLGSVEWFPPVEAPSAPPADSDNDGILDRSDACPDVPGVATTDPTTHGCPVVIVRGDADRDGIFDDEDACVDVRGVANNDKAKHGCPLDSDGDGILDSDDACISVPGEPNDDKTKHGCPKPKDRDEDGILDAEDACPDQAGPSDPDPAKHGCPRVQVTESRVVILDRIEFDTNKATIRPESDEILQAVFRVLSENPQLARVRVEGHTDNRGSRAHNVELSRQRARAVVEWLVKQGIPAERLLSTGLGPDRPVDSNDTDTGRQNNRRVEFHIESKSGGE